MALNYSVALDASGSVWQWGGYDDYEKSSPHKLPIPSEIVWVGAIDLCAFAVDSSGQLFWWKSPSYNRRSITPPEYPTLLPFDRKILEASVGIAHLLIKADDKKLYGMGENYDLSLLSNDNIGTLYTPTKLDINRYSVKAFVAGKIFSAILTNKNKNISLGYYYFNCF